MGTPFADMTGIDRLVHDPSRLAITSALSACESADFLYLQRITGLSKGNLSSHLAKLEKGGIVKIDKTGERRPRTVVSLTKPGRVIVTEHWNRLISLHEAARTWTSPED
ncbi:transcriptional regulator [Actinomadura sp. 7K507]|uniref:transcriptional regulator n=1 Tax=Actinomadura sp. 7K507 TaxID=2530365 RepID=UPI001052C26C|nr:transcriptional regulator [Actinomadura sp. 7K507]TDC98463.1 ArsR family transcriptional regulator [Actinomadura sp. 7K507]